MIKISELLGKPVLSLYESSTEGYVKNIIFGKGLKKVKWIILFEDKEFQEEKIVGVNSIYHFGENAIVLRNRTCLNLKDEVMVEQNNPINNPVYTTMGKFLGTVTDVLLDEKFVVQELELDHKTALPVTRLAATGSDAIIVQDETKSIKIARFKNRGMPNKSTINTVQEVKIMPTVEVQTESSSQTQPIAQGVITRQSTPKYTFNNQSLPLKLSSSNYHFLIGRKAEKNIYSDTQELIIRKNNKITQKTVTTASIHGKLRELTMFSL